MSCTLAESCKLIIESKDKEIQEMSEEIEELESKIGEYETKDKILKGYLMIQATLLVIAFQIWTL